ncbi:MAG: M48 family metalloprotease [Synechococcales bacterium]|nr:M48 family metalloprotease [Synechococcales bacterium]
MNQVKTVALLGMLSGLLVAIGYAAFGGTSGALMGLMMAAVMNLGSWYFSDKIALAAYGAQPVTEAEAPDLHRLVKQLSDRAQIPMPALYVVPNPGANAFATGRDPNHAAVAVTSGIVDLLSEAELEAVIAHELSHVANRDTLTQAVAATIGGAISYLANMVMWFGVAQDDEDGNGNGLVFLLTAIVAPLAATVIQLGISRTREFSADAGAAKLTGNPRALVSALQRLEANAQRVPFAAQNPAFSPLLIVNPLSKQFLANLFSTHPSTEARVAKLLELEQELMSSGEKPSLNF